MVEVLFRMKGEVIEDVAIRGGLVGVQFVYAGNAVLLSYVMSFGLDPLTIVIFSTLATFIILSPLAAYFERYVNTQFFSARILIIKVIILINFSIFFGLQIFWF